MLNDFLPSAILIAMIIVACMALFFGWSSKPMTAIGSAQYPRRLCVARFAVLLVSAQALLFIALWTPLAHYQLWSRQSFHVGVLLLPAAVPCDVWGRIQYRWWLVAAAIFLPIVSWVSVLAEVAY